MYIAPQSTIVSQYCLTEAEIVRTSPTFIALISIGNFQQVRRYWTSNST